MNRSWSRLLHILIVLALPLAMLAVSFRLTAGHWLVHWEYGKADFPPDPYGLPTEERVRLAEVCVDYLVTSGGIELLGDLRIDDAPAFNASELEHMVDVKRVLWWMLGAGIAAVVTVVGGTAVLASRPSTRSRAPTALLGGSLLGLGLLAAVGVLMLTQWNVFFNGFHELFFPPGTWTFPLSDTLIRLYPVRFWMDVGMVVAGLFAAQGIVVGVGSFVWQRLQIRGSSS